MYAYLFRRLPGPVWLRVIVFVAAAAAVLAVCFTWVFPALLAFLQGTESNRVGEAAAALAHTSHV